MKKFLVAAALAAAALTPLGAEAQMKDSLIIGMALEPAPGLDPTVAAAAAISQVTAYNVYENLVRIDESGTVSGMLASDWSISEDGMTYRFNLLSGVKFHDGTTFDA